ncbi:MAG: DUF3617 family protein [Nitrospirota bacterium]
MKRAGKLFLGLFLAFASLTFVYAAVNMQEGEWETTMEIKVEMPESPFQMPPMTFKDKQCLTKEDFVPKTAKKDKNCKVLDQKITGNKVVWKVKCVTEGVTTIGEGEITYGGISYNGIMKTKTTDSTGQTTDSTSKLTGRRLGACKK